MEVTNRLAFDADLVSDEIVGHVELRYANDRSQLTQRGRNSRLHLADVSIYRHTVHVLHTMDPMPSRSCAVSVPALRAAETWADFPEGKGRS